MKICIKYFTNLDFPGVLLELFADVPNKPTLDFCTGLVCPPHNRYPFTHALGFPTFTHSPTYYIHFSLSTTQAGQTPLQTHAKSRELWMALVAGGADPNVPLDEQENTLLHQVESPEEITLLLESPLMDVNVTNQV